jgi:hypothetical protein
MQHDDKPAKPGILSDGERAMVQIKAVRALLSAKIPELTSTVGHLARECSIDEQARLGEHPELQEKTIERAVWHAGYVSAMQALLRLFDRDVNEWPLNRYTRR